MSPAQPVARPAILSPWMAVVYVALTVGNSWPAFGALMRDPVSLIWIPAGIGLAAVVRGGWWYLAVDLLASLTAALIGGRALPWAVAMACGRTAGLALSVLLMRRGGFRGDFGREREVLAFIAGFTIGTFFTATWGAWLMRFEGLIGPEHTGIITLAWWMGDWMGTLAFAPLLVTFTPEQGRRWWRWDWQRGLWGVGLAVATLSVMLPGAHNPAHALPWVFVPLLVMSAAVIRFGLPAVVLGTPLFAVILMVASRWRLHPRPMEQFVGSEVNYDWLVLFGLAAIGWMIHLLQAGKQREQVERIRAEEDLRSRSRMFRAVLDNAPLGIWMQDASGRLLFVNRAFCAAVGIPEERFLAVPHYRELYDPATASSCMVSDAEALAAPGPHHSHERLRFVDGQWHEVDIIKCRLHDETGAVSGLIGISMDVTERRHAEESLRLLSTALNTTANAVLIAARDGTIEWVNAAFSTLTGYSAGETIGRRPGELLRSGRHSAEFYREMWEVILAGRTWRGQIVNRRRDGTLYTEEQTITPMRDATGRVTRFVSVKEDITSLVAAQQALSESEERYRLLFEDSPVAMFVCDETTLRPLAVNAATLQLYGYPREEFLALVLSDLRANKEEPCVIHAALSGTRGNAVVEVSHVRRGGEEFTVELHVRPIEYADHRARLVLAHDITERKRMQEQLLRTQRMESIGLLAAGIAHDLNNILTPVRLVEPMFRHLPLSAEDRRILGLVETSAKRGAALIRQILTFAHGTGNERTLVPIKEVLREVALFVHETFPRELQFQSKVPANLWSMHANPTQIHQVLLNLCVNARDAMPGGGTLRLTAANVSLSAEAAQRLPAARAGTFICIEVADSGCGISAENLPRIWDPFFTTKAPTKGTGLGLATVHGILDAHEGFCVVESTVGSGTTFRVYLPAAEADPRDATDTAPVAVRGGGELVLIVDDEVFVRDALQNALEKSGYRSLVAFDGVEALRQLELHGTEIRLLITDMQMPRLGGARLIPLARESRPALKILAMSGDAQMPETLGGVNPDAFIPKPFRLEELHRAIDALLRPAGG